MSERPPSIACAPPRLQDGLGGCTRSLGAARWELDPRLRDSVASQGGGATTVLVVEACPPSTEAWGSEVAAATLRWDTAHGAFRLLGGLGTAAAGADAGPSASGWQIGGTAMTCGGKLAAPRHGLPLTPSVPLHLRRLAATRPCLGCRGGDMAMLFLRRVPQPANLRRSAWSLWSAGGSRRLPALS